MSAGEWSYTSVFSSSKENIDKVNFWIWAYINVEPLMWSAVYLIVIVALSSTLLCWNILFFENFTKFWLAKGEWTESQYGLVSEKINTFWRFTLKWVKITKMGEKVRVARSGYVQLSCQRAEFMYTFSNHKGFLKFHHNPSLTLTKSFSFLNHNFIIIAICMLFP